MKARTVSVVGLGYVGLPLAVLAAERGWNVIGFDTDAKKIATISRGESPFEDAALSAQLQKYPIIATTEPGAVVDAEIIIIAVPTPVTEDFLPDLTPLKSALVSIRPFLQAGQVLIIESTINPGVMDELVIPCLQERTDLVIDAVSTADNALHVAHCPERVNPGDKKWTVRTIPRVIGGYTQAGTTKAADFYRSILDAEIKVMNSVMEAEAVKILENTFRDINIAFINEMAKSFDKLGIDITNVIAGAATKPFAFMPHYPGNGVGGHCISVDPYYMIERARQVGFNHEFLKLARQINDSMPGYTIELLREAAAAASIDLASAKVAVLGLAYKKNIDDIRESPALDVVRLLREANITTQVFDPHVRQLSTVDSLSIALQGAVAVMLACDHDELVVALIPETLAAAGIKIVIDGRNALDGAALKTVGIIYHGVGRS